LIIRPETKVMQKLKHG